MDAPRDDDPYTTREQVVELLSKAVIRLLTETNEPESSRDSRTVPQSGLSSSRNHRSL